MDHEDPGIRSRGLHPRQFAELLIPACILFAASVLRAETVNARDLGAVGDGKTDDPAAPHRAVVPPVFPTGTEASKAATERLQTWRNTLP